MALFLKKEANGVKFEVAFSDKINVLKGASGTGKSFLFSVISSYCASENIPYALVDYRFVSEDNTEAILQYCKGKEIIILDNADLYLTPELFMGIQKLGATMIISKKTTFGLDMREAHLYAVDYIKGSLKTRRIC